MKRVLFAVSVGAVAVTWAALKWIRPARTLRAEVARICFNECRYKGFARSSVTYPGALCHCSPDCPTTAIGTLAHVTLSTEVAR